MRCSEKEYFPTTRLIERLLEDTDFTISDYSRLDFNDERLLPLRDQMLYKASRLYRIFLKCLTHRDIFIPTEELCYIFKDFS